MTEPKGTPDLLGSEDKGREIAAKFIDLSPAMRSLLANEIAIALRAALAKARGEI